jgi:hypothetical protein
MNSVKTEKKRAALPRLELKLLVSGKNPALGIFPKATIYAKTAFIYDT